jgi:hypothetical protein
VTVTLVPSVFRVPDPLIERELTVTLAEEAASVLRIKASMAALSSVHGVATRHGSGVGRLGFGLQPVAETADEDIGDEHLSTPLLLDLGD